MKKFIILLVLLLLVACNTKPDTPKPGPDTFPTKDSFVPQVDTSYHPPVHLYHPTTRTVYKTRTIYQPVYQQPVKKKKRISGTAKGAIIGGVAGAAGTAIISKHHKGRNAVIGGVVGAGAGAIIGKKLDKHKN